MKINANVAARITHLIDTQFQFVNVEQRTFRVIENCVQLLINVSYENNLPERF